MELCLASQGPGKSAQEWAAAEATAGDGKIDRSLMKWLVQNLSVSNKK